MRYRVFLLTTYSLGLRLEEALSLQVGDIDAESKRIHVRRGKGHKNRLIPLPDLTLQGLRDIWRRHRHPCLLFPNAPVLYKPSRPPPPIWTGAAVNKP
ncbi:MAG: tyrosine-type recombinase/integrase [Thermodesulfobacteriota bacterium]|nr:tyrosine-type recombinase/integrase [Thermodesulfobacteriota bacterium]